MRTRAERARNGLELALLAYGGPDIDPDDIPPDLSLQDAVTDALANLMHFAALTEYLNKLRVSEELVDFNRALSSAEMHFEAESHVGWDEEPT